MATKVTDLKVVKLTKSGLARVLDATEGMTFIVDSETQRINNGGTIAHVRDYRYPRASKEPWGIWTLGPGDYVVVACRS